MSQPGWLVGLEKTYLEKAVAAQVVQEVGKVDIKALEKQQELTIEKGSRLYSIKGKAFQMWVEA